MKQSTIKKYTDILLAVKNSGKKLAQFCADNNLSYSSIVNTICALKRQNDDESEEVRNLINLYNEVTSKHSETLSEEALDTDDRAETSYIRDDEGKIKYYRYQIFRKNKTPLSGKLTREEMNAVHRLYSYYGDSLTQRIISRHFVDLSLVDFKRILRAFNITKASAPFAPHMFEEYSEEELRDIQLREKENSFLRKAEEDQIKNTEKLLKKYAQENIELRNKIKSLSDFSIDLPENIVPIHIEPVASSHNNINLYLADFHIGAAMDSSPLYKENINYGKEEVKRRLSLVLNRLADLSTFNQINLVLMGDNVDCCGVYGKTARLDHDMPENMNVRDQANAFIEVMLWFINSIISNKMCSTLRLFAVPEGNHSGILEYMCNKALFATVNAIYPDVETTLWEEFFGVFSQNNEVYLCCHGKDARYMKKGLPLNLDDKTQLKIYEWLHEQGVHFDKVHVIKGDLHSNALNSCKRFDYRNVLSLFGASDYSNYNFSRNSWGVSYDMYIGDNLVRGTFENL